jgi:hypothetical protein
VLFYVLIVLYRSMYCLCVNVYYCHLVTTKLQLTNISYHINCVIVSSLRMAPECRNVGVLTCVKGVVLRGEYGGKYINFRNVRGNSNIKLKKSISNLLVYSSFPNNI